MIRKHLCYCQIVIILFISNFLSVSAKEYMPIEEEYKMQSLDITEFNKNAKGFEWLFTKPDGTSVLQTKFTKSYVEKIQSINTPYTYYNEYDLQGRLIIKSTEFYNNFVGRRIYFDPTNGSVIKEEDYDKGFNFTIDDLSKKMKDEYQFNIMNKKETENVSRLIDPNDSAKTFYVVIQRNPVTSNFNAYLIDGNKGTLLYKLSYSIDDDEGSGYEDVYQMYLESTRQK